MSSNSRDHRNPRDSRLERDVIIGNRRGFLAERIRIGALAFTALGAYPPWALTILVLDGLVIYGLTRAPVAT